MSLTIVGALGMAVAVFVLLPAVTANRQYGKQLRAEIAELEQARADAEGVVVDELPPLTPRTLLAGQVIRDSHDPGWQPVSPDLIA